MKRLGMFFLGLAVVPVGVALLVSVGYGAAWCAMFLGVPAAVAAYIGALIAIPSVALAVSAAAY
ncbi:hypothetical protein [Chelatococcus sp. HY11]|uniref:hypothetical protein n=1 Tax=Chelatococcus sp. HY11 TaxID=2835634 RepID=UPI001BCAF802|nr:hypothetical protein [Chelatococcus sp. HY11]MBS7737756.1 hypothetical protein [Chelatococcus sp. HY11]MCO5077116.1 hypothetical protein [Chelatococcus sp.]CAH1665690.1 hypothetical protein CHELA41_22706 [Hyphomicrobiales bacterium]CAH1681172.1 hypothetical protein CHELA20_52214 [Hyphomicrobiales bacterium]